MAPRKDSNPELAAVAKRLREAAERKRAAHAEAIKEQNRRSVLAALARLLHK